MNADYSDFCRDLIKPIPSKSEQPPLPPRQRKELPVPDERRMVKLDGDEGELCTGPVEGVDGDVFDDVLKFFKLDPAVWMVADESVRRSSWEQRTSDGEVTVLTSYRARIQRRRAAGLDIEALMAEIRDHEPHVSAPAGEFAFVVAPADLQCGKGDPEALVRRYLAAVDEAVARLHELREMGRKIGSAYILFGGDLVENVQNYYANQPFIVTLNTTEQLRVVRRLMLYIIKAFAPLVDLLVVGSAPGNHDQPARNANGKAVTDSGDSFATDCLSAVADVLAENPAAYGHVRFVVPPKNDPLVLTLDVCGTGVAVAHGHQFLGKDGHKWWAGQSHGLRPAGDANVLISGHFHHLRMIQNGPKLWLQVPSLDVEGSEWYTSSTGEDAPTGMATLVVGQGRWQDFATH